MVAFYMKLGNLDFDTCKCPGTGPPPYSKRYKYIFFDIWFEYEFQPTKPILKPWSPMQSS